MIKLPLRKVIILFVDGQKYLCRVIHAGKDIVTVVDCYEIIITPDGMGYIDDGLKGKIRFERSKISGYKLVEDSELDKIYDEDKEENEELLKQYIDNIAKIRRKNFKLFKFNSGGD